MGQHAMGGGAMAAGHMAWPGGMQQMQGALGTADSATLPSPLGLEQPAKKRRRKKQPRDPNCPKRPTPPFLLFCLEQRVALKAAEPHLRSAQIQSRLGAAWREAS